MDDLISRQAVKELAHKQIREKYCGTALKEQRDFYIKLADSIIDLLPSAYHEPHWIPVTQALPEDDTVVLVCGKNGGIYTAIHNNSKTWTRGWWKMNSKNHYCNPTAWMPLPEPYKG